MADHVQMWMQWVGRDKLVSSDRDWRCLAFHWVEWWKTCQLVWWLEKGRHKVVWEVSWLHHAAKNSCVHDARSGWIGLLSTSGLGSEVLHLFSQSMNVITGVRITIKLARCYNWPDSLIVVPYYSSAAQQPKSDFTAVRIPGVTIERERLSPSRGRRSFERCFELAMETLN